MKEASLKQSSIHKVEKYWPAPKIKQLKFGTYKEKNYKLLKDMNRKFIQENSIIMETKLSQEAKIIYV